MHLLQPAVKRAGHLWEGLLDITFLKGVQHRGHKGHRGEPGRVKNLVTRNLLAATSFSHGCSILFFQAAYYLLDAERNSGATAG